jgi:type I restriction enzyme, R subunit
MSSFQDDEKHLSQLPALHLLQNLGYQILTRREAERERRGRLANVVLEDILSSQLKRINRISVRGRSYEFTDANIQTAIERLKTPRSTGLLRTNEEVTDLLLLGAALDQAIEGETRGRQLRYIDWEDWGNNAFHVCAEFEVERSRSRETRRPDIVLFVNGIPFATIECKGPQIDIEQGISQTIRNQGADEIPYLFQSVQLVLTTNKNSVKFGTVGTPAKFWSNWREQGDSPKQVQALVERRLTTEQMAATYSGSLATSGESFEAILDQQRAVTEQDCVIYALCRPERLLDLARRFTLFDLGVKKIARYQQFFAVKKLIDRVKERDADNARLGGVIWHTQGSGKSLTMVMMARALALQPDISNPRVLLVTDRIDLDKQLKNTFAACGLEPHQARSGRHLLELLSARKSAVVTTLINKFDTALRVRDIQDLSTEVFLLVDESQRSQYGPLHSRMRKIFPKACYIGFTGTPLLRREKSTFARFGGVIDIYGINQAVQDGAVVPLLYEGRHVEQRVNQEAIDNWFERVCEGLTDQQKADLKRKYSRASALGQTEQTIFCIAFDVSEHFRQNWQGTGFKAQLVTPSKRAAIQYQKALEEIGHVSAEVIISPPDEREGYEEVNDEVNSEVQRFWKKMMERYGDEQTYNDRIIESFKKRPEPEILIVVDKLLTGFDAPKNTVMYITKKMKEHNLLQAIARVNRVEENKDFGFVVDYQGLLGELDRALTAYSAFEGYDEADVAGVVRSIREEIQYLPSLHSELWDIFKEVRNKQDEEAFEVHLVDEKRRDDFYERLTAFGKALAVALSSAEYANDPKNEKRIRDYCGDLRRFQNLRRSIKRRYQEEVDFREYEPRIRKLLDTHISAHEITRLTEPVNIFDDHAFEKAVCEQTTVASKADLIASATKRTIVERLREDPAFYEKFSRLIQETIDDFRSQRISDLEYLKRSREIREAVVNRKNDDLPPRIRADRTATAFYGVILEAADHEKPLIASIADVATDAALSLEEIVRKHQIVNWVGNVDVNNSIINDIEDYLFDVVRDEKGIPLSRESIDSIIERVMQIARLQMAA